MLDCERCKRKGSCKLKERGCIEVSVIEGFVKEPDIITFTPKNTQLSIAVGSTASGLLVVKEVNPEKILDAITGLSNVSFGGFSDHNKEDSYTTSNKLH